MYLSCCLHLREQRQLLEKCAATALNSKLIAGQKEFFSKMVVDAVMSLDELLSLKMIGIKKVQGGALEVCIFNLKFCVIHNMTTTVTKQVCKLVIHVIDSYF